LRWANILRADGARSAGNVQIRTPLVCGKAAGCPLCGKHNASIGLERARAILRLADGSFARRPLGFAACWMKLRFSSFLIGLALISMLSYPKTLVRIVWLYVKDPIKGLFTALIEDETTKEDVMFRIAA
jgi:hypothetical protein